MPIFRKVGPTEFAPFERTPFEDFERVLEDWIEANPDMLLEGERVAFIGRQAMSRDGKFLDLLAIDESGACVVVELKRGQTPRDVVAQTLEYAAWVDSLTTEDLDEVCRTYSGKSLAETYRLLVAGEGGGDGTDAPEANVTFNNHQRLVIVAERFSPEVEQTLRYLRTRLAFDVTGINFGIHRLGEDVLIETEVLVGREATAQASSKSAKRAETESDEHIVQRADSEFVRRTVYAIEEWIGADEPKLQVRHGTGSNHSIYRGSRWLLSYYYAARWVRVFLPRPKAADLQLLDRLSNREAIRQQFSKTDELTGVGFRLETDTDLEVLTELIRGPSP